MAQLPYPAVLARGIGTPTPTYIYGTVRGRGIGIPSPAIIEGVRMPGLMHPEMGMCLPYFTGVARDDSRGYPTGPSLRIEAGRRYIVRCHLQAGGHSVSVWSQHPQMSGPSRALVVRKMPALGLLADLEAVSSGPGDTWQRLGPLMFSLSAAGQIVIELQNRSGEAFRPAWFDRLEIT